MCMRGCGVGGWDVGPNLHWAKMRYANLSVALSSGEDNTGWRAGKPAAKGRGGGDRELGRGDDKQGGAI